jgi:hypothetical protein
VTSGSRLRWSLVLALAAHAGAFAWTRARTGGAGPAVEIAPVTEVDVDEESAPSNESTSVDALSAAPGARDRAHVEARRASDGAPGRARAGADLEPAASSAPSDGAWTFSPTGVAPIGSGLSSAALDDAMRAGLRATVAEDKKRSNPMRDVLPAYTEHDIELGLFPGGELVTLTRDAVRTSLAPSVGHALLEFQIDGAGMVASVRVVDASSDRSAWDEVATDLARTARAHPVRVPTGSHGLALTLDVSSAMKTLSGSTPTDSALTKALRAVNDPIDSVIDGTSPARRVVAARVVDVHVL